MFRAARQGKHRDDTASTSLDLPAESVTVTGDGGRLHQVIANLLANARVWAGSVMDRLADCSSER